MKKVYVVMKEDCFTYGEWDTDIEVFSTYDKAKEYLEEEFKDFLNSEDLKLEDLKSYDDADSEEWILDRSDDDITCYRNGYYVEDHFKICIKESIIHE